MAVHQFNKISKARHLEYSSKGGKSKTPAKKFAARIRELKKHGLSKEIFAELKILLENENCDMVGMLILIEYFKELNLTFEMKLNLINLMIQWNKLWFHEGRKEKWEKQMEEE
jgi:hypothetical protein